MSRRFSILAQKSFGLRERQFSAGRFPSSAEICAICGSFLFVVATSGCRPAASGQPRPLVVVISGDTAGWLAPCGCASNQSGGLLRRGSYVGELRQQADVVVADVGGAPAGRSAYDRLKFQAILQGEAALGTVAHNIGAAEAALGADFLRQCAGEPVASASGQKDMPDRNRPAPLLSANVRDRQGRLVGEAIRLVRAGTRRLALVGVMSPRYAAAGLQATAPQQAVLDAIRSAPGPYDALIVLAYMPEDELRQLAEALPEADVVAGGPTGQPLAPKLVGPTLLVSATRQGKFLVRLDAPPPGAAGPWSGRVEELDGRFPDDPRQTANLNQFRAELARQDFRPQQTDLVQPLPAGLPADFAVAGNNSCEDCHAEDCRLWKASRHAQAWPTLQKTAAQADPDCQRCHTTGYGLPGGFQSAGQSRSLVGVGCESCHGPSQGHVRRPETPTPHFHEAKNVCTACHDRENSPKFAYAEYWKKIRHGDTPATEPKKEAPP